MLELRQQLAEARINLRSAKDHYELANAEAEQKAITNGCGGKNAEERERNLLVELNKDQDYREALDKLRKAEAEVDRQEALLEGARDARRYDEWTIRARLIDVLQTQDIPSDSSDPAGDAAFDDAMLWRIDHMATAATNGR